MIEASANFCLRAPSKVKGTVTTPTDKIFISWAILAITGNAPVPVPAPSPAVKKTISAPFNACLITSASFSAAS